jgi:ABC-2 type transport system ATP-binding protein
MRVPEVDVEPIVDVRDLRKVFRVSRRQRAGLWSSAKSLVRREHREVVAVDRLDLAIPAGEVRGLIGPNGAGKSTTIKLLTGVIHPTDGQVRCLGVTPWLDRVSYVRRIGAIFGQKRQLIWDLPALDTFALCRRIYQIPKIVYRRNLEYFVDTFGLSDVVARPVRTLSLGERMRCELTAALLHDPALIFLDEPTIGMDLLAKDAVRGFVKRVNRERGVTVLLTTHDLDDVEHLCRRVTVINHGRVVFDHTLDELRRMYVRETFVALRFTRSIEDHELAGWNVQEHSRLSCTLVLDPETDNLPKQISEIMTALPVHDIEVRNSDIDSIVRRIYRDS